MGGMSGVHLLRVAKRVALRSLTLCISSVCRDLQFRQCTAHPLSYLCPNGPRWRTVSLVTPTLSRFGDRTISNKIIATMHRWRQGSASGPVHRRVERLPCFLCTGGATSQAEGDVGHSD
jgi:hypothetical protein